MFRRYGHIAGLIGSTDAGRGKEHHQLHCIGPGRCGVGCAHVGVLGRRGKIIDQFRAIVAIIGGVVTVLYKSAVPMVMPREADYGRPSAHRSYRGIMAVQGNGYRQLEYMEVGKGFGKGVGWIHCGRCISQQHTWWLERDSGYWLDGSEGFVGVSCLLLPIFWPIAYLGTSINAYTHVRPGRPSGGGP